MLRPAHHVAVLGVDSLGSTHVIALSPDGDSKVIHTFPKTAKVRYGGIAYALFDPASSGDQKLPWRRGDILVSRSTATDRPLRAILRLRPRYRLRRLIGYDETVIYSRAGAPIQGLAFDPHGRLYAAQADAKRIYRLQMDSSGKLEEVAWTATPATLPWKGDFSFSPDGMLFLSSGEGDASGQVFKFSIGGDPRPGPVSIQLITYRAAYTARGEIRGFSFFDNDSLLFVDGQDAYYRSKIDPALDPASRPVVSSIQPVLPGSILSSLGLRYSDNTLDKISVIDIAVMLNAWQSYLERHTAVRAAISWSPESGRSLGYSQWLRDAKTASMERRLHRMYGWIAAGESAPLTYRWQTDPLTGSVRIGPEILQAWGTIGKHDAEDGYLAFLAHCLWMQVHNKVPWNLHDYSAAHLELLLDGANLFRPSSATGDRFSLNEDVVVNTMPSDPALCFAFLTGTDPDWRSGPSFIQATRRETIFAFTRWVMDHIVHGSNPSNTQGVTYYGYNGYPPVETMLRRMIDPGSSAGAVPHYWSWQGCHTSAGLMIHLMRLLLIPAGRTKLYDWFPGLPEPGYHGGVDFPTEQLACLHTDEFYAMPVLLDPYLSPEEIYNGGPNESYSGYLAQFGSMPADAQAAGVNMTAFLKQEAIIAARNGTNRVMKAFWGQDLVNNPIPDNRPCEQKYWNATLELTSFGLTTTEAAQLLCDNEQKYLDFIANFRAEHAAELPSGGDEQQQLQAAFSLYQQMHDAWMAAR